MSDDEIPVTHYDHYRRAKSCEEKGEFTEALEAYQKAIDMKNDYAHAWFYKSLLHTKLKQYDDAVCCAERALELEPSWEKHVKKIVDTAKKKL
ncbi:MAG: tetratricopeptide repeat protein [Candidatus Thorarchaeota archaeon]|nr:tetratricopeptide repeat protein [Candidatus Thorarchaeota archaeon]